MRAHTTGFRFPFRRRSTASLVVAIVCVVLLGILATVQVAHIHSSQTLADHCPLCVSLHSAAPIAAVAAAAIVLVQIGKSSPVFEQHFVPRRRIVTVFTRPPPVGF